MWRWRAFKAVQSVVERLPRSWAYALAAYLDRRAAMKVLRQMDDRELCDIGLTRSRIEQAVCGVSHPDLGRLR